MEVASVIDDTYSHELLIVDHTTHPAVSGFVRIQRDRCVAWLTSIDHSLIQPWVEI